jgi:hypothetical protein
MKMPQTEHVLDAIRPGSGSKEGGIGIEAGNFQ